MGSDLEWADSHTCVRMRMSDNRNQSCKEGTHLAMATTLGMSRLFPSTLMPSLHFRLWTLDQLVYASDACKAAQEGAETVVEGDIVLV